MAAPGRGPCAPGLHSPICSKFIGLTFSCSPAVCHQVSPSAVEQIGHLRDGGALAGAHIKAAGGDAGQQA